MKIHGDREKTDSFLYLLKRFDWVWRHKFTLVLFCIGATTFAAGVVAQREDVIGASKRFVISFFDETNAVSHYIDGLGAAPERLTIDIKYKHYTKLVEWRRRALEQGQITSDLKNYVPAEIRYEDKRLKVKLRLKGQWTDHVETEKWSFRVKVRNGDTLFGMRRFSLQHPMTRSYGVEPAYLSALAKHDIVTVRYRFVAVTVNGRDLGVYALEEAIAKKMLEHRKRREGVVVRYSSDLHYSPFGHVAGMADAIVDSGIGGFAAAQVTAYGEKRLKKNEALWSQFLLARNMLERFRDGELPANAIFDLPRWAYFFAVSELMGAEAITRDWKDRRFLYNPLTMLLEPVGVEGAKYYPLKTISGAMDDETRDAFHSLLFQDQAFFEHYIAALQEVSSPSFVDELLQRIDSNLQEDFRIVYSEWPRWSFPKQTILQNAEKIRAYLNPKKGLQAYFFKREKTFLELEVGVIQALPLEILDVAISGSIILRPEERSVLRGKAPKGSVNFQILSFPFPSSQKESLGSLESLVLRYRILGSDEVKTSKILAPRKLDASIIPASLLHRPENHHLFPFLAIDVASKIVTIKPGKWTLEENLILPRGYEIRASQGVQISLAKGATILSRSRLRFIGTRDQPIVIEAEKHKGGGMLVQEAPATSVLEYVEFRGLAAPQQLGLALTGAVTFYESAVEIRDCAFRENRSEDGLNIIRSDYLIERSLFSKTPSDALDSDFSRGRVVTSEFKDIGGDGLDFSGSQVVVEDLRLVRIGDKGFSIGEASSISGKSLSIDTSFIGVAVKDQSEGNFVDIELKDTTFGVAVFQKKPEFGPAKVNIVQLKMVNLEREYVVETGSRLVVDGQAIAANDKAVSEKFYGTQ